MYEAKAIDILPGIFAESSDYAAQGRYIDGDNVRFWKGYPERIGGNIDIASQRTLAPTRGLTTFRSLSNAQFIACGHARGVELIQGGTIYNISPQGSNGYVTLRLLTGSVTSGPFTAGEEVTTSNGAQGYLYEASADSPIFVTGDNGTLLVALSGISGTYVSGEVVTATGGGTATVLTGGSSSPIYCIRESGTFTGTLTGAASGAAATISSATTLWTGTVTGTTSGATATITSVSEEGVIDGGATAAWGSGTWGDGVWGGAESVYSSVTNPTTWTFAQWGEDLMACPRGGKIYRLDTSAWEGDSATNMALMSANAPSDALGIFMSDANRTLVAYGAHDGSAGDPLNIAWCDEEDYTVWAPTASNTAGSLRCEAGSAIIGQMNARGGHLISTDAAVYLFRYIGLPFVFSLEKISDGAPLISPHASAELNGVTYWMSPEGFYYYDGTVQPMPCDLHAYVFDNLSAAQAYKVCCGTIRQYNEIWWFYAKQGSTEVDSFVAYNASERVWFRGSKSRTSWVDTSTTIAYPVGVKSDGAVQAEEYGSTDNGDGIDYHLTTNDIEIQDGSIFQHSRMLIPDYDSISGTHQVTINARGWPSRAPRTKGPFNISSATEKLSVRCRGRFMQFKFSGSTPFRLGRWRYRVTAHGRRP